MRLATIRDRLRKQCPIFGGRVQILTTIEEIDQPDLDLPAAFVLWSQDTAEGNDLAGTFVNQARTRQFVVLIIGRVPRDDSEPVEDARAEVFQALIGFEQGNSQITYASGQAQTPDAGYLRWQDTYQFTDYLRY